jgi:hypothetical protein
MYHIYCFKLTLGVLETFLSFAVKCKAFVQQLFIARLLISAFPLHDRSYKSAPRM